MSNQLKIRWETSDGYLGSAPQSFTLGLDEMVEICGDEADARDYLEREIQEDFQQKVTWSCKNFDAYIQAWKDAKEKSEKR